MQMQHNLMKLRQNRKITIFGQQYMVGKRDVRNCLS